MSRKPTCRGKQGMTERRQQGPHEQHKSVEIALQSSGLIKSPAAVLNKRMGGFFLKAERGHMTRTKLSGRCTQYDHSSLTCLKALHWPR